LASRRTEWWNINGTLKDMSEENYVKRFSRDLKRTVSRGYNILQLMAHLVRSYNAAEGPVIRKLKTLHVLVVLDRQQISKTILENIFLYFVFLFCFCFDTF
jgi:hypothetical protein